MGDSSTSSSIDVTDERSGTHITGTRKTFYDGSGTFMGKEYDKNTGESRDVYVEYGRDGKVNKKRYS